MAGNTDRKLEVTLPADNQVRLVRKFDAPADMVFRAWTEPQFVRRWWVCGQSTMPVCEVDLRVGGHWHWVSRMANAHEFGFYGIYQTIDRPERLEYSECFDPTAQHTLASYEPSDPSHKSHVVLELIEEDGVTTAVSTATYASQEVRDFVLSTGMAEGAAIALDRLAQIVEELRVAA